MIDIDSYVFIRIFNPAWTGGGGGWFNKYRPGDSQKKVSAFESLLRLIGK